MLKKISRKSKAGNNTNKVITVNSSTYGTHTRAARGSKSPVTVNNVLTAQAGKTGTLNATAKAVYDVLKLYSEGFREGQLWQGILSRMRKANSIQFDILLQALDGLELNSRYALSRFGNVPMFDIKYKKKVTDIQMDLVMRPRLHKNDDCYQYTLIALLFDAKGVCIRHLSESTGWTGKNENVNVFKFSFEKPARTRCFLFCLELKGGVNGIATDTLASRGMVIVEP